MKTFFNKAFMLILFVPVAFVALSGVITALITKSFKLGYDMFNLDTLKANIEKR